jgi:dipeptidyl aminopeptidase/acylaminoacyl peptidase
MASLRLLWALAAAGAGLMSACPVVAADEPIPVRTFFANRDISAAKLSPSGRHLALTVAATSGRVVLAVLEVDSNKPPVVVADAPRADVRSFEWVNDERLVYNLIDLQAPGSDQLFGPGLFSVKRDGSEARQLLRVGFEPSEVSLIAANVLGPDHQLLFVPTNGGNDVIVGQYQWEGRELVGITPKRLDVTTGRSRPAALGLPSNAVGWVFDRNGEPRAAVTVGGGISEVYWRDAGKEGWRSLRKGPALNETWHPIAVDASDTLYVVAPSPASTSVLKRFDFAAGAPEPEPIVSTPGFDAYTGLVFEGPEHKRLVGIRVNTDAETTVWFDPERKKLQALVDARFPDRINRIACSECLGEGALLVQSYSDRDPGVYSIYRPSTRTWTTVGRARRAVDPQQMAVLDMHRIKARDGLDLPVWVTTPRGKPAVPRAAVVLVHGGPWVRGTSWEWDPDAQFLASRGYVVIEPEYRGSTGFGRRHFVAGFKNWGTTMQDDVADAVRWATDKGLIDGKRVCIAGASYGGYATLMGAIKYPDLYRCGVAWVAVTDPLLLFGLPWVSDMSREAREFSMPILIGDPVKDAAMLKAAAPVERASEIKIPILMAYGGLDRRVPIDHGERMRAAMQAAGQQPEYIVYDGEGHGWLKVENRIDFWQRVEKFLAKNLN